MHPEVRQVGPGSCPKCGMALEPLEPRAELADMTRRLRISVALTVPLVVLTTGEMALPDLAARLSVTARLWFQLILAAPVVLWGGWPFFVRGWQSLVTRSLNMFTLIARGTGAAFGVPGRELHHAVEPSRIKFDKPGAYEYTVLKVRAGSTSYEDPGWSS